MKLAYQAYDHRGKRVTGTIDAVSPVVAREGLRRDGLFVTELSRAAGESGAESVPDRRPWMGRGKRLKNLTFFTRQLSVLVSTGTPLAQALQTLASQARHPGWKGVLQDVHDQVQRGESLSEAMGSHPYYFDRVYRSLVAVGESSGQFASVLIRLADLAKRNYHMRASVMGAMIYPALLFVVSVVVLVVLLAVALPRFVELFESMEVPLPPTTKALVLLSDLMIGYWWLWVVLGVVSPFAFLWTIRRARVKRMWDGVVLRVPRLGSIARGFYTARLVRLFGVLMDSHVPLLESLRLCREAAGNIHYERVVTMAEAAVIRGDPVSAGFTDSFLINPAVYETIRNGERSGQVGPLLLNVADFLDDENDVVLRSLTSIIEPFILIGLGVFVGFVAVSLFMPLFDLTAVTGTGGK